MPQRTGKIQKILRLPSRSWCTSCSWACCCMCPEHMACKRFATPCYCSNSSALMDIMKSALNSRHDHASPKVGGLHQERCQGMLKTSCNHSALFLRSFTHLVLVRSFRAGDATISLPWSAGFWRFFLNKRSQKNVASLGGPREF